MYLQNIFIVTEDKCHNDKRHNTTTNVRFVFAVYSICRIFQKQICYQGQMTQRQTPDLFLQNISQSLMLQQTNVTMGNVRFIINFFIFIYLFLYLFMDLKFHNLVSTKKSNNDKRQIYTQLQIISQSLLLPQTNVTTANIRVIMFYTIAEYFAIFIVTTEKRHNGKRQIYTLLQNILQSLLLPQTNVTTAKVRFIFVSYPKTDRC